MAANTATTVKSSGTATVATDLASGGWVQWVMIAYLDTTGTHKADENDKEMKSDVGRLGWNRFAF